MQRLREQIDRLEQLINRMHHDANRTLTAPPSIPPPSRHDQPFLENAAETLEHLIVGDRVGQTAGVPDNASQGAPPNAMVSLSLVLGLSPLDQTLWSVLPSLLPNTSLAKELVQDFFIGPIHKTWHVGLATHIC